MNDQNTHDVSNCFGHPGSRNGHCTSCEFRQSCKLFSATAKSVDRRSKLTSFEEVQSWHLESADFDHIPGISDEEDNQSNFIAMLGEFFHYLVNLDDYTIGIICKIVNSGKNCTVTELGKLHGCSRQAMHRKILNIIAKKPELSSLLQGTMYKLSRGRQRFIRNRCRIAATEV